jgi:CheY-like chemotaxis protein
MLLLTDLTLPGDINGRDLAREILARLPHLRVIYMSGYSEEAARHQNHLDASIRLLQKPYSAHELQSAIEEALQLH